MRVSSSNAVGLLLLAGGLLASPPAATHPHACGSCHGPIVESFAKTGMGRSIQSQPSLPPAAFYHRLSNRHYAIRNGRMRRHQLDARNEEIQIVEKSIDFGIGSGNHAVTFVHRTPQGALIELPLSWYAESSAYAMSPGYDAPDHFDMRREISGACLFCHAAYPQPGAAAQRPASIDCERCHGGTRAHLANPKRGNILNPAALPPARQLDVCLQCHLQTVSQGIPDSFRHPGRALFSFRPGEPLGSYKTIFDRADDPQPRFEVNHAGYRLLQSSCFKSSNGKMTCTTCHNPHTAQVRNACQDCHASSHARASDANCVACHMPARRPSDAIHVTMTDHWIQRRPMFQNPDKENHTPYQGPVIPFFTESDSLTLAIANITGLTPSVPDLYRAHLRRDPNDVSTLAALGNALFRLNRRGQAIPILEKTLRLDPAHAGALNTLAVAHAAQGAYAKAIALLNRARLTHPDHALTWVNLGVTYAAMGQREQAAQAYREAIRLQPDFAEARTRLAALLAATQP